LVCDLISDRQKNKSSERIRRQLVLVYSQSDSRHSHSPKFFCFGEEILFKGVCGDSLYIS
jgi:hypothetical protein